MSNKKKTKETALIEKVLRDHFPDSPEDYPPEVYRYNPAAIRVRLVNPRFQKKDRIEREEMVLPILQEELPKETWWDVTSVLLLSPDEVEDSFANREFENPTPSRL